MELTKEYLHSLFEYKDGELYWKISKSNIVSVGEIAGSKKPRRYKIIRLDYKTQQAHRLIFMMHYGYMPVEVDHIDGNILNNKIENLREADRSQNLCNTKISSKNTSGKKNISWSKRSKKWQVQIAFKGKRMHFGYYDDLELADLVAQEARDKFHGVFARDF
jgi:hypothetical protein